MLPRFYRLRSPDDFSRVYQGGRSKANRNLVCYKRENGLSYSRFGFSLSRKFGKAHKRNLYKRRLSEIIRLNINHFKPGYDIVFIARKPLATCDYVECEKSLMHVSKICGVVL